MMKKIFLFIILLILFSQNIKSQITIVKPHIEYDLAQGIDYHVKDLRYYKDINDFHFFHSGFSTLSHSFANGADGSMYVMTIEDQDAYDAFVAQYPESIYDSNADWQEGTDIRTEEDLLLKHFKDLGKTSDEANDLAFGYLVGKYNMGIMVSKKGADGNFHPIQVEKVESIDPLSGQTIVSYQKTNPCNL